MPSLIVISGCHPETDGSRYRDPQPNTRQRKRNLAEEGKKDGLGEPEGLKTLGEYGPKNQSGIRDSQSFKQNT